MVTKLALRVNEFAESIGVSRSKAYELISSGEVPHIRLGGSVRIPVDALREWLAQKTADTTHNLAFTSKAVAAQEIARKDSGQ